MYPHEYIILKVHFYFLQRLIVMSESSSVEEEEKTINQKSETMFTVII